MWSDGLSIEQRVFRDLPWSAVQTLVDFAASQRGETSVRDSILSRLRSRGATPGDLDLDAWISNGIADDELRLAIGSAAKSANGQWFKTIDAGEFLGSTIASVLPQIRQTDLALKLETLKGWACAK